ncbi:Crp/Fnr family transcriptional regulator [Phenylobacterium hankyongense]|uniref:Crp/Fnr family transcriptional regulator n=1 Tax=Phenylobacterium hankyongense TaxID=1813876 RepID=A0A328ATD7_9CAUL|nr:Crp/Fnr family transcriptional regulator [Phenylobacterium hankyongense]RAK58363.1 Crp/Fnr family transcriptional regulator [Phenylobacterium hankyongense]
MTGRFKPRLAPRPLDSVLRRLRSLSGLSEAEQDLVRNLSERRERHAAGDELIAEGQTGRRARFVVSGWACNQRVLPDGRRQIFSFLVPGDVFGLCERPAPPALSSVVALTALETVEAEPVVEAAQSGEAPGLARALAVARLLDQGLLFDHMVRLGRQTAYERVAHFLLELQRRLEQAGLGDSQRFPLPLTQEILADALGLSIVHVNRTLQQLRRERLIELRSGVAILLQPELLAGIADYRPTSLGRVPPAARTDRRPA